MRYPPLAELLPHRAPAILLDSLVDASETSVTCTQPVRRHCPFFVEGKGIAAHVAIEWMAQACGVYAGWQDRLKGREITLGLLLGTRNFQAVLPWFAPGLDLRVEARLSYRDAEIGVFDCSVRQYDVEAPCASAQLTVYQPDDIKAFLEEQGQ